MLTLIDCTRQIRSESLIGVHKVQSTAVVETLQSQQKMVNLPDPAVWSDTGSAK